MDDGRAISGRDFAILMGVVLGAVWLFGLGRKYLVPSRQPDAYRVVDCGGRRGDACCVEAMVTGGRADDDLVRLTGHGKHGRQWTDEVVLWRKDGSRTRLASHVKTPTGKCVVVRYVLRSGDGVVDALATGF